ncbi:hypothetical protein ACFWPQ_37150 [Streptomyces sp. NPDC058464]|uniref:hypothetical protein n=1 Tax=Streptomyces sp. NPDC058464 TaxID=3346511 RepID=UPI003667242B
MRTRFGTKRRSALGVTVAALVAIVAASAVPGAASAVPAGGNYGRSAHWGVITRNTIGSPVAALRDGPFVPVAVRPELAHPPYGHGSLGIEVADHSTSLSTPSETVHFGNEVDFYGAPVLRLHQVGFHVFQTGENVGYGHGIVNMPNIRFEINPNLSSSGATYSSMVWNPPDSPVTNQWSGYLDATTTGGWWLTGNAGTATGCTLATQCTFPQLMTALNDGGAEPVIYTAGVSKGRDFMWIGAVDGLRINETVFDFEPGGVRARHAR